MRRLLELARKPPRDGHVYTLRAEVEGTCSSRRCARCSKAGAGSGYEPVSLRDYAAGLDLAHLPRRVIVEQEYFPGTRGSVAAEGKEFLA